MKYKSSSSGPIKTKMFQKSTSSNTPVLNVSLSQVCQKPPSSPSSPEIRKKKRLITLRQKAENPKTFNQGEIQIPDFKEIHSTEFSDSLSSGDNTDSEFLEDIHNDLELNEYFSRARPEIRKVKANGKSTEKVHLNRKTEENLKKNLEKLSKHVPDYVMKDYLLQGVHYLPWICCEDEEDLEVTFNRFR